MRRGDIKIFNLFFSMTTKGVKGGSIGPDHSTESSWLDHFELQVLLYDVAPVKDLM